MALRVVNMSDTSPLNCKFTLNASIPFQGVIDANAYHCNVATWPIPLTYVYIDNTNEDTPVHFIDREKARDALASVDGTNISHRPIADMGNLLVKLNSRMYNEKMAPNQDFKNDLDELTQIWDDIKKLLNGRKRERIKDKDERRQLEDLERKEKKLRAAKTDVYRKDIPSLLIVPTMDMELAHIGGYDGEFIYQQDENTGKVFYKKYGQSRVYLDDDDALMFQTWARQISDVEAAAIANPLRLFPLFSYDPRRYRLSGKDNGQKGWGTWKEPFARIVGHGDHDDNVKKIWLGFCMNPNLGFRPFDEFCEHLPRFYKECEKNNIPILAHCAPGGITTHDAVYYSDDLNERIDKNEDRCKLISEEGLSSCQDNDLCSYMYYGEENVINNSYDGLDYFYMNYGHPRNWIPVLEYFPDLRLCLTGFGGSSEWQLADWSSKDTSLPTREWIIVIIQLTAKYKNVFVDISGLNIYDEIIRNRFLKLLDLIQNNDDFKHLKYKLIFGSDWYLTHLTDVSDGGKSVDGRNTIRHSYSNYCREFRNLFDIADKGGKGEFWEHVSLINPWYFYSLSENKIHKIHNELSN